ncbi:hypothetical protein CWB72_17015 [Pseudoalteromonas phenolica]|nr:hypothetical protein CWB72_17015 [Pseudoalteromonas phenolica]
MSPLKTSINLFESFVLTPIFNFIKDSQFEMGVMTIFTFAMRKRLIAKPNHFQQQVQTKLASDPI